MSPASSDPIIMACGADDAYAMPLAVTVRSLLDNLEREASVRLFVIDGGLSEESKKRLRESWPADRLRVEWLKPDLSTLDGVKTSGHIPITSYFRLLVPDLLPADVERAIYLDSDLVVLGNLAKLW